MLGTVDIFINTSLKVTLLLIISQNLTNYSFPLPANVIFRINLAWVNSMEELRILLDKHVLHSIFLDLPINRTKPPDNNYTLEDLIPVIRSYSNVKYLAISNVNNENDLIEYLQKIPQDITIVPKIESPEGVDNIASIVFILPYNEKILMLDHDDLYSALAKQGRPKHTFKEYFNKLVKFCNENEICLLRTVGVVFSDEEKKVSEYIK